MKLIDKVKQACDGNLPKDVKELRLVFNKENNKIQGLNEEGAVVYTTECQIYTNADETITLVFQLKNTLIVVDEDGW